MQGRQLQLVMLLVYANLAVSGFQKSHRGVAYLFGADAVLETCAKLDIDLVARAHQASSASIIPLIFSNFSGYRSFTRATSFSPTVT